MNIPSLIYKESAAHRLDPKLVACIIYQESGGDPDAYRFEDAFYDRYIKTKTRNQLSGFVPKLIPTLASEKRARSASWGLMQVMGETARLIGFKARWLTTLARPELNIQIGCKYLRYLFDKAAKKKIALSDQLAWVLTRWNGSSEYPKLIFEHLEHERWRIILQETKLG